jgi:DNA-binding NarL/FixJ family response regulator
MKRVIISEDQTMFALMIKMWMEQSAIAEVIAVAATGADTLTLVHQLKPDVLLQDMMLNDMQGVEIIRRLRKEFPEMSIFAMSGRANLAKLALEAGANGCMLKEDSPQVIRHILDWEVSSGIWVSPLLGEKFFTAAQELMKYNFSNAEINVLRNISLSNNEIAATLGITEGTVRNSLSVIYQKTNQNIRAELARWAHDVLLLSPAKGMHSS